jgi:hypothetical protein
MPKWYGFQGLIIIITLCGVRVQAAGTDAAGLQSDITDHNNSAVSFQFHVGRGSG